MIIISPSKNLNLNDEVLKINHSLPLFLTESRQLTQKIKTLDVDEIKSLMNVSDSLAKLNFDRFKNISKKSNIKKAAGFLFSGDTFNGLAIRSLGSSCLTYAQKRLRILSGLYGILKPFDLIEPYRLEMGTKINGLIGGDLYNFWSNKLTSNLNKEIRNSKSNFLFNLSSNEYSSVVNFEKLDNKVISFDFKKVKDEKLTGIGMVIKKIRGAMANYIISNQITSLEKIKKFNQFKFKFYEFDNKNNKFLFISK